MDRPVVNFLVTQFTAANLAAALNALLNPRQKRASTRTARKVRKARRNRGKAEPAAE